MESRNIRQLEEQFCLPVYKRLPGVASHGKGARLWNTDGKEYIDLLAGLAVNALGHCHPAIVETIQTQAAKLLHTGNSLVNEHQVLLAQKLCEISGASKVFFNNDGTGAIETALKVAKKYGGAEKPQILSLKNSFHGRTLGAVSATHQERHQASFRPLLPGFEGIPANDLEALRSAIGPQTAAFILEPIQGEGGVLPINIEYLQEARKLTQEFGALLIIDEIQTGFCRTGSWFCFQQAGITPDIVCVAKALGAGFPIGACLFWPSTESILSMGEHGSTFGGNPLACAVGRTSLATMEALNLSENARKMGEILSNRLASNPAVKEVRGNGLMVGAELHKPLAREVVERAFEMGAIINATNERTLRLLPPLIITEEELSAGLAIVEAAMVAVGC